MARHVDLTRKLAALVVDGALPAGAPMPSVRRLAAEESASATTVQRVYAELARAGVVVLAERRGVRVAPGAELAARRLLRGGAAFRLAGSDDPALALLLGSVRDAVELVGAAGSFRGLTALWRDTADGAALHLRHRDGSYNAPFARALLAGRDPVLVHLWQREQGLIVPGGNPRGSADAAALLAGRVAQRPRGTGTRTLMDRLVLEAGGDPGAIAGPEVELHLDVAIAVATGEADVGLGLRSAALTFGLDFVPLVEEPFEIITTRAQTGGLEPLLRALADADVRRRVERLGGYDLSRAGEVVDAA
jgi:putative molybdopterin biosynthesis protein